MGYERGRNPNSQKNLEKGRTKGKGKGQRGNYSDDANTFKALYEAIGTLDISNAAWAKLGDIGITKKWCKARGITHYRKLLKAVSNFLDDSPAMVKEVAERVEGKVKDEIDHNIKGQLEVFNHDAITGLLAGRPSRDHSASGSNQGS